MTKMCECKFCEKCTCTFDEQGKRTAVGTDCQYHANLPTLTEAQLKVLGPREEVPHLAVHHQCVTHPELLTDERFLPWSLQELDGMVKFFESHHARQGDHGLHPDATPCFNRRLLYALRDAIRRLELLESQLQHR